MKATSRLKSSDYELIKMIESVTKVSPEVEECEKWYTITVIGAPAPLLKVLEDAIIGRMGYSIFKIRRSKSALKVQILYSNFEHNSTHHVSCDKDDNAGELFKFKFENIRAVRVSEENKEELFKFTGGGEFINPVDKKCCYGFVNNNGIYVNAIEGQYIIRIDNYFYVWYPTIFNILFERQKM